MEHRLWNKGGIVLQPGQRLCCWPVAPFLSFLNIDPLEDGILDQSRKLLRCEHMIEEEPRDSVQ